MTTIRTILKERQAHFDALKQSMVSLAKAEADNAAYWEAEAHYRTTHELHGGDEPVWGCQACKQAFQIER